MIGIEGQKIAGAVLFALILLWGAGIIAEHAIPPMVEDHAAAPQQAAGGGAGGGVEVPFAQLLAGADPQAGQTVGKKCASCHTFEPGGAARIGPNLAGVVGRKVAGEAGFAYSPALQQHGGTWTADRLNSFLAKPSKEVPGTKMTFAGLPDAKERANLIAYLQTLSPGAPQTADQSEKVPAR